MLDCINELMKCAHHSIQIVFINDFNGFWLRHFVMNMRWIICAYAIRASRLAPAIIRAFYDCSKESVFIGEWLGKLAWVSNLTTGLNAQSLSILRIDAHTAPPFRCERSVDTIQARWYRHNAWRVWRPLRLPRSQTPRRQPTGLAFFFMYPSLIETLTCIHSHIAWSMLRSQFRALAQTSNSSFFSTRLPRITWDTFDWWHPTLTAKSACVENLLRIANFNFSFILSPFLLYGVSYTIFAVKFFAYPSSMESTQSVIFLKLMAWIIS